MSKQCDVTAPLTSQEEIRLSTLSNCITLAAFRPLDTFSTAVKKTQITGKLALTPLWKGWPLQAINKIVDDEIFNLNIRRITSFAEDQLQFKDPSKTPYGRALVGTLARCLTLLVIVPYNSIQDPSKRKGLTSFPSAGATKRASSRYYSPILYQGLGRSLIKESVFTSSYVLLSAYFGNVFARHRRAIAGYVDRALPDSPEEKKKKYASAVIATLRAASAGAVATIITQPIDMAGRGVPVSTQIIRTSRKAVRKGAYNGINALILQGLLTTKIHRRLYNLAALDTAL